MGLKYNQEYLDESIISLPSLPKALSYFFIHPSPLLNFEQRLRCLFSLGQLTFVTSERQRLVFWNVVKYLLTKLFFVSMERVGRNQKKQSYVSLHKYFLCFIHFFFGSEDVKREIDHHLREYILLENRFVLWVV